MNNNPARLLPPPLYYGGRDGDVDGDGNEVGLSGSGGS